MDKAGHLIRLAKGQFEITQDKQRRFGTLGHAGFYPVSTEQDTESIG